jgi:hypothetical protein
MRSEAPYRYTIELQGKLLGPFDRRTIVGMRIKKLLDNNTPLQRSDGHILTVAQLMVDKLETADERGTHGPAGPLASRLWPIFTVDFGGSWRSAGALGFTGKGELRFQGDLLRLTGRRKTKLFSSKQERIKLPVSGITQARVSDKAPDVLLLSLDAHQPFTQGGQPMHIALQMENALAVTVLLQLMTGAD